MKFDLKDIRIYRAINNMTRYNTLFFHMEWIRSIGHISDTLTTHASIYKNHRVLDNTILKRFYYISNILYSNFGNIGYWKSRFPAVTCCTHNESIFNTVEVKISCKQWNWCQKVYCICCFCDKYWALYWSKIFIFVLLSF